MNTKSRLEDLPMSVLLILAGVLWWLIYVGVFVVCIMYVVKQDVKRTINWRQSWNTR